MRRVIIAVWCYTRQRGSVNLYVHRACIIIFRCIYKKIIYYLSLCVYTYVNKKCNRRILIRVGKLIPDSLLPGLFFFRALLTNKEGTRVFIRPDPSKEQPYLNDRKSTICTFLSESNTALSFFVRIESV
jgi:hypothetical protein